MNIRCSSCGNEILLSLGRDKNYMLFSREWYDAAEAKLRCPKCKNAALSLELAGEPAGEGPIRVRVIRQEIYRPRHA